MPKIPGKTKTTEKLLGAGTSDEKLSPEDFGRQLVETEDLDPIYTMLWRAELPPEQLRRWLLAYWCYYSAGTASWIVDQQLYWEAMMTAACSSDYPRGTERRHFRGELSKKSVNWLWEVGLDLLFTPFLAEEGETLQLTQVMDWVQTWVGFGPWIAFKVADMLERLDICPVSFTEADTFLFDSPKKGAIELVSRYANGEHVTDDLAPEWAFRYLDGKIGPNSGLELLAPPRYERPLGPQEWETVLCKVRSYWAGKYWVGHDIKEVRESLLRFSTCRTAQRLVRCLPPIP